MPNAKSPNTRKPANGKKALGKQANPEPAAKRARTPERKAGKAAKAVRGKVVGDGGKGKANGKGAPKGNEFWRARSKHGRDKTFQTPEDLWTSCCEYFDWCVANPLLREKKMLSGGRLRTYQEKTAKPFTLIGLTLFLGINRSTWAQNYRTHKDFISVCSLAEDTIRDQKFAGAAAGHYNANIIAKDLGMEERIHVEDAGSVDAGATAQAAEEVIATITDEMSDKDAAAVYKEFTRKRRAHTGREQT
jgi:hypothetical protein